MKKSILPILLILVFNSLPAQSAPDSTLGNWLMYFGTHRFNEEISLHYETQLRNYELLSNFNQLLPRVGINYHINNQTVVTAGYAFIPTQKEFNQGWNDNLETENRIWEQFILRNSVGNIKIRHRYRLEQRWVKSGLNITYKNRARYMLSVKLPISKKKDFPIFISLYDEIFLNLSNNPFDQNRLYGALGYQINYNTNIQLGYLKHRNAVSTGIQNLNRLQIAVFLNTGI